MEFDFDYDINSNEPEPSNSKTTETIQNEEEIEISSDSDRIRPPTPLKKTKYSHKRPEKILPQNTGGMSKFQHIYTTRYKYIEASKEGVGFFFCKACDTNLSLGKRGEQAIIDHAESRKHKKAAEILNKNAPIHQFIKRKTIYKIIKYKILKKL